MSQEKKQITLLNFFRFRKDEKIWGMRQMRDTQLGLNQTPGLVFHKMLGTGGGGGYGIMPDFGTYALLTVWEKEDLAKQFESASKTMQQFRKHAFEVYSLFLQPVQSRGYWSKKQPFTPASPDPENNLIVVLTRATLKMRYYFPFWKRVSKVSQSHQQHQGLIFTKGLGERPWIMQVTFSVWQSIDQMEAFAHNRNGKHFEAIKTTREKKGFKEELYSRFQPIFSTGTWHGKDPVGHALTQINKNSES